MTANNFCVFKLSIRIAKIQYFYYLDGKILFIGKYF